MTEHTPIGTAAIATAAEAQDHYRNGGTVLVHDGSQDTCPVTRLSTTHSLNHGITSWHELEWHVKAWSHRHPNQNYYLVDLD